MKHLVKNKKKMLKRKMINTAFLLIFSVIAVSTYYTANFSRAKDIVEVSVNIKNAEQQDKESKLTLNATAGSDGESFYVKLPNYIENKKVIKYSYYLESNKDITTSQEQNSEDSKQTVENDEDTVQESNILNEIETTQEEN